MMKPGGSHHLQWVHNAFGHPLFISVGSYNRCERASPGAHQGHKAAPAPGRAKPCGTSDSTARLRGWS